MQIEINTQSSIKLKGSKTVYFDPYLIDKEKHDADYIFITHDHYDHYDESSIRNIISEQTLLIVPKCLEKSITITENVLVVEPNKTYTLDDLTFETVPSYNIAKPFHPKEKKYVGYNVLLDGTKYYIMGDTDRVNEIDNVKTDICFVPIGGTYTMNVEEAANYINYLKPKKAIPTHYGSIVGDINLKDDFKNLINKEIEVEIYIK